MSTKFVPFTTRPLSTSRHGITRLSSPLCDTRALLQQLLRLLDREPFLIERLAGDHPRQVHEAHPLEGPQVVERSDASAVDEAAADHVGDGLDLVEVGSL